MNDRQPATHEPVIVVGAGPVGCTAALLLADFGIRVTLLERHTQPHPLALALLALAITLAYLAIALTG